MLLLLLSLKANNDPYNFWTRFVCDSVMGPTVFKTAKMRRDDLGGGIMLTEVILKSVN